nr:immunoglobulin heavy chain junction region [Mus musculus]MBK4184475.1 immunoglobulin heavy chain junction region [Mus musculus]
CAKSAVVEFWYFDVW